MRPRDLLPYVKYYPPDDPYYLRLAGTRGNGYSDANAFDLVYVDPAEIVYCSRRPFRRWGRAGEVMDGDWDRRELAFEDATFYSGIDAPFYRSLETRFERGVRWKETPFVEQVLERVESGRRSWGCSTAEEVRARCEEVDRLYRRIAARGYRSQRQRLRRTDPEPGWRSRLFRLLRERTILGRDEVAVDVGRDGRLLYYDGKHRLSIAKLLGIDEIPVRVVVRHAGWQAIRDRLASGETVRDELCSHPDLDDLAPPARP